MVQIERLHHAGSCVCDQPWRPGRAGMAQRQRCTFCKLQRPPAASSYARAAGNTLCSLHEPPGGQHCGVCQRVRDSRTVLCFAVLLLAQSWPQVLLCLLRRQQGCLVRKRMT